MSSLAINADWLKCFERNYTVAHKALMDRQYDTAVETYGVDVSTIRAMPTGSDTVRPLSMFSDWAREQDKALGLVSGDAHQAPATTTIVTDFPGWHSALATSLADYWKERMTDVKPKTRTNKKGETYTRKQYSELVVAHKYKLVDLYVRGLRLRLPKDSDAFRSVMSSANIPLDQKSIAVIEAFLGKAPRSTTMGDIKSEEDYSEYQDYAHRICGQLSASVAEPPSKLIFDTFAWWHPHAQKLYTKKPRNHPLYTFVE